MLATRLFRHHAWSTFSTNLANPCVLLECVRLEHACTSYGCRVFLCCCLPTMHKTKISCHWKCLIDTKYKYWITIGSLGGASMNTFSVILKSAGSFSLLMSHDKPSISCIVSKHFGVYMGRWTSSLINFIIMLSTVVT